MTYHQVIDFWFDELAPEQWWTRDDALDEYIAENFLDLHQQAVEGDLADWRGEPLSALAEIIVLDQFSRNIYRGSSDAFSNDALALSLSREAIEKGFNQLMEPDKKQFLYLPFMHSESLEVHEEAMALYSEEGLRHNLDFEVKHREIIDRFGRYPNRNEALGRESTDDELAFLEEQDSSF